MLVNLNDILYDALENKYAVGLFNTTDTDFLQAALEAAEDAHSPIIIGTAEVLLPYGDLQLLAPSLVAAAKQTKVPVVVHFDHGLTVKRIYEAIGLGFSSVMYDGSLGDATDNINVTAATVTFAHERNVSVEGEIGHVGEAASASEKDRYTTAAEAVDFVNRTNVDALAVAIGTAHGVYKEKPLLNIDRLKEIRAAVKVPLVLHGGSGLGDDDFADCIKAGISKINIFTDLTNAALNSVKESCIAQKDYLTMRNAKKDAVREEVSRKIKLFASAGRY